MAQYRISVDLAGISAAARSAITAEVFPLLNQAVRAVAQQTQINWMEAVHRAKLWSGEKDLYAGSIQMQMTGPFSAVVWTDYKHATEIETGRPARDLKKYLDTSAKVRRTKDGRRFLVIPFRHNTPGNAAHARPMPKSVHKLAEQMTSSRTVGQGQRPSGEMVSLHPKWGMRTLKKQQPFASDPRTRSALLVNRNVYAWGDKLDLTGVRGMRKETKARYQGMVRFDTTTPGGKRSSQYLTFRIMMDGQKGWIVPPQPGQFIAQKVVQEMQPLAEKAFGEAMKRTLG